MYANLNNTLLAFLLSLKYLDSPLSQEEKATLFDISEQISINASPDPETWKELTEPALLAVIQGNESLKQRFQTFKSQLDSLNNPIFLDFLPTETELDQVAPKKKQPVSFVIPDNEPTSQKSYEITNMVIRAASRILETPQPDETIKKLSSLDKKKIPNN